jgi:hypothetical protein
MLLISSSETKGWRGQTGEEGQSDKALEITRWSRIAGTA